VATHREVTVARAVVSGSFVRDPVLVTLMALTAGIVTVYGAGWGPQRVQVTVHWATMCGLHLSLVVSAGRVTRSPAVPRNVYRVWAAAAVCGCCFAAGDMVQLGLLARGRFDSEVVLGAVPQSLLVLVGSVILVGALLTTSAGWSQRQRRIQYWLDVVIVLIAATTFGGYSFVAGPAGPATLALGLLTGPGVYLVGAFAIVRAALAEIPPMTGAAGCTVCAAASLEAMTQAISWLLVDHGRLSWLIGLTLLASTLLAAGARIQQLHPIPRSQEPGRAGGQPDQPQGRLVVLPYVAIASTNVLLVVVLAAGNSGGRVWIVIAGTITSTGLVVARQLLAFAENRQLIQALDASVARLRATMGERDQLTAQLHHKAYHDALTGLPNRALFTERLRARCGEPDAGLVAVIIVDLDDFKPINDTHGHGVGDQVLAEAAARMQRCAGPGNLVARIGGDEFAILVQRPDPDIDELARGILKAVSCPIVFGAATASISASVGIAAAQDAPDAEQLLADADKAMYAAKHSAKGTYQVARVYRSDATGRAGTAPHPLPADNTPR
jgi:diguanylate cyclase (GGDEF)-like protein